jgi:hypothetical protein
MGHHRAGPPCPPRADRRPVPLIAVPSLFSRRGERSPIRQDIESLIGSAAAATSNIGTELASFLTWTRESSSKRLPSNSNGLDWRRPVQKELTGLFDELAAFNERIAEPSNEGPIRNPPRSPPPAYFDAQKEPLVDEYRALFDVMEAPPANAQKSATPFKDVVDLAIAIARAKGLDAANAEAACRISLGLFFADTGN